MEEIVLLVAIGVLRVKPADSGKMCALWGNPSPCVTWSLKEASPDQKILALRDDFLLETGKETEVSVDLRRARFRGPWVGKIWRRKWQLSPGFLSGKFHGQRCLTGYSLWVCNESDMTEQTHTHTHTHTHGFRGNRVWGNELSVMQMLWRGLTTVTGDGIGSQDKFPWVSQWQVDLWVTFFSPWGCSSFVMNVSIYTSFRYWSKTDLTKSKWNKTFALDFSAPQIVWRILWPFNIFIAL